MSDVMAGIGYLGATKKKAAAKKPPVKKAPAKTTYPNQFDFPLYNNWAFHTTGVNYHFANGPVKGSSDWPYDSMLQIAREYEAAMGEPAKIDGKATSSGVKVTRPDSAPARDPNIVPAGTRVSFRGNALTILGTRALAVTQSALDRWKTEIAKGEYKQIRTDSNYSEVIAEATLGHDKVSLAGVMSDFINSGKAVGLPIGNPEINITEAVPEKAPSRLPRDESDGGGGLADNLIQNIKRSLPGDTGTLLTIGAVAAGVVAAKAIFGK